MKGVIELVTDRLGWQFIPNTGELIFLLDKKVLPGLPPIKHSNRNFNFKKGNFKGQYQFLMKEIFPYKETRVAFTIGLSSIVASFIENVKPIGCLAINVSGTSSSGKSTISELSASLFGDPNTSNYGLVRTFNATENFLYAMSEGRYGIPIIIDDTNVSTDNVKKSDLVYKFVLGTSKGRCTADGDKGKMKDGWSGIVIITSESPLLEDVVVSRGALARSITIEDVKWTQDADHSIRIKEGVRQNYGYFAEHFSTFVLKYGVDKIVALHEKYSQSVYKMMKAKDELTERLSTKIAPILVTADLVNRWLQSNILDIKEIAEFIVSFEQRGVQNRDIAAEFYEQILDYVSINHRNFDKVYYKRSEGTNVLTEYVNKTIYQTYGLVKECGKERYVAINKSVVENFCKSKKIFERTSIFRKLAERGQLIKRDDEHYIHRRNQQVTSSYYKFVLPNINQQKISFSADELELHKYIDKVVDESMCENSKDNEVIDFLKIREQICEEEKNNSCKKCDIEIPEIKYESNETIEEIFGGE